MPSRRAEDDKWSVVVRRFFRIALAEQRRFQANQGKIKHQRTIVLRSVCGDDAKTQHWMMKKRIILPSSEVRWCKNRASRWCKKATSHSEIKRWSKNTSSFCAE